MDRGIDSYMNQTKYGDYPLPGFSNSVGVGFIPARKIHRSGRDKSRPCICKRHKRSIYFGIIKPGNGGKISLTNQVVFLYTSYKI